MWSLLLSLGSFSVSSLYYFFLLSYCAWAVTPIVGGSLAAYKFYTFYQTTSEDNYMHSKLLTPTRRRLGQATSEFVDWMCDLIRAMSSLSFFGTLVRSRLGITKKASASIIRPSASQRIRDVKASLQAAATSQADGIPKTRSLQRHGLSNTSLGSTSDTSHTTNESTNEPTKEETGNLTNDAPPQVDSETRSEE